MHAYQPNLGVIATRGNLASLTDFNGKTVCAVLKIVIQRTGGVLGGILGKIAGALNNVCDGILGGGGAGRSRRLIKKILRHPRLNLGGILGLVPQFRNARRLTTGKIGALVNTALGGGRDARPDRGRCSSAAALVLSGCGFNGLYGVSLPGGADPGDHPMTVTAYFADVLDLVPQSAVKFNDVAVGKVTEIALAECPSQPTGPQGVVREGQAGGARQRPPALQRPRRDQADLAARREVRGARAAVRRQVETRLAKRRHDQVRRHHLGPRGRGGARRAVAAAQQRRANQIQTIAHEMNSALHGNESTVRDLLGQLNTFVGTLDAQKEDIINALDQRRHAGHTLNRQKQVLTDALDTYPAGAAGAQRRNGASSPPC